MTKRKAGRERESEKENIKYLCLYNVSFFILVIPCIKWHFINIHKTLFLVPTDPVEYQTFFFCVLCYFWCCFVWKINILLASSKIFVRNKENISRTQEGRRTTQYPICRSEQWALCFSPISYRYLCATLCWYFKIVSCEIIIIRACPNRLTLFFVLHSSIFVCFCCPLFIWFDGKW